MLPLRVLLICDSNAQESHEALSQLEDGSRIVLHERSVATALHRFSCEVQFDAILLMPSFRNQFSAGQVTSLRERFPTARHWTIIGSWLEGETRSGTPLATDERIYLHQLTAKLHQGWLHSRESVGQFGSTAEERKTLGEATCRPDGFRYERHMLEQVESGQVLAIAELADQREYLCELFSELGIPTVGVDSGVNFSSSEPVGIVLDAFSDRGRTAAEIGRVRRRWPDAPIVVLSSFPRTAEISTYLRSGANRVVGKPFVVTDLLTTFIAPPPPQLKEECGGRAA